MVRSRVSFYRHEWNKRPETDAPLSEALPLPRKRSDDHLHRIFKDGPSQSNAQSQQLTLTLQFCRDAMPSVSDSEALDAARSAIGGCSPWGDAVSLFL